MEDSAEETGLETSFHVKKEFREMDASTELGPMQRPRALSTLPTGTRSPGSGNSPAQSQNVTMEMPSMTFEMTGQETPGTGASPDSKRRAAAAGGMSNFIKVSRRNSYSDEKSEFRRKVMRVIGSPYVANFMVFVVLLDSYCTCADIDAKAQGDTVDAWFSTLSEICLVLYTVEIVLLLSLKGVSILKKDVLMIVDLLIIICGYAEWILGQFFTGDLVDLRLLRTLRLLRIIRLLRLLRKLHGLRELQKLIIMMATCLKALAWSFLFCFVIMTVWAMLMVEMVHPLIQEVHADSDSFVDCEQCLHAASSVMHANLLLFKTVIAGDSWGKIAVPVIEAYPATAFIFMGSLLTIVFGVLNLIVAVVVDTFAEARERDVLNLAEEMERNHENDKKFLQKVFERIDEDGSGELTLEELVEGARQDPEFQSRLRVMDIDEVDLQQLFEMIDVDGSGSIEAAEFIAPLSRWVHESKTAPRFIKYNMLRSMQQQDELYRQSHYQFNALITRIEDLSSTVESLAGHRDMMGRGPRPGNPVMPVVPGGTFERTIDSDVVTTENASTEVLTLTRARSSSVPETEATEPLDEIDHQKHSEEVEVPFEHMETVLEQPQASATEIDWTSRGRKPDSGAASHGTPDRLDSRAASHGPAAPESTADLLAAFSSNSKLLKAAMESMETALMASTESAIRRSMALVEYAIHEELNRKIPGSSRNDSHHGARESQSKWTALFGAHPPGDLDSPTATSTLGVRRSSRRTMSFDPGPLGRGSRRASVTSPPATPKETEEAISPPVQDMGDRIYRSRRRINTGEVPIHFSRRVARHSFANAQLQFSAKV